MVIERLLAIEISILDWISKYLRCVFLDYLMPAITRLGDHGFLWILLAVGLLLIPKERSNGIQIALALFISFLICNLLLKNLVGRIRPFDLVEGVQLLITAPEDYSFPSGHTSSSFAVAFVLLYRRSKGRYLVLVLAALIGFSRLYLYVHFPSDVFFGVLTGVFSGYFAVKLYDLILFNMRKRERGKRLE